MKGPGDAGPMSWWVGGPECGLSRKVFPCGHPPFLMVPLFPETGFAFGGYRAKRPSHAKQPEKEG